MKAVIVIIALTTFFDRSFEQRLETNDNSTSDVLSENILFDNKSVSNIDSKNDSSSIDDSFSVNEELKKNDTFSNGRNLTDDKSFPDQSFSPNVTSKVESSPILSSTNLTESLFQNNIVFSDSLTQTNISEGSDISTKESSPTDNTISYILSSNNETEVPKNFANETLITDSSTNDTLSKPNATTVSDILSNNSSSNLSLHEYYSKINATEISDISTNKTAPSDVSLETRLSDNSFNDISSTDNSFDDGNQTLLSDNATENKLSSEISLNDTFLPSKSQTLDLSENSSFNSTSLSDDVPPENGFTFS